MGKQALSPKPRPYTPADCREDENPASYTIRSLNILEAANLQDTLVGERNISQDAEGTSLSIAPSDVAKYRVAALRAGLLDWQNVVDANDDELEFSEENMLFLHPSHIEKLVAEIVGDVSEEEEGNSETQS